MSPFHTPSHTPQAGFRQFQHTKCGAALHHWIALSQLRSAARQARRARRLALTFAAWASVARRQRRAARAEAEAERRGEARRRRLMQNCWLAWAGGVRRDVALRRRGLTVGQRAARERVRRALSVWKGLWARVLFLRNQVRGRLYLSILSILDMYSLPMTTLSNSHQSSL